MKKSLIVIIWISLFFMFWGMKERIYAAGCGGDLFSNLENSSVELNYIKATDVFVATIVELRDRWIIQEWFPWSRGTVDAKIQVHDVLKGQMQDGWYSFEYSVWHDWVGEWNHQYFSESSYIFYKKMPFSWPCWIVWAHQIENVNDLPSDLIQFKNRKSSKYFEIYDLVLNLIHTPKYAKYAKLFYKWQVNRLNKTNEYCENYTWLECLAAYKKCKYEQGICQKQTNEEMKHNDKMEALCLQTNWVIKRRSYSWFDIMQSSNSFCACPWYLDTWIRDTQEISENQIFDPIVWCMPLEEKES